MAAPVDMDSGFDWRPYVSEPHRDLHLRALRPLTVRRIGWYLDQELDAIDMDAEVMRDFSGLADLIGFDSLEIQHFEGGTEKGRMVINEWMRRDDLREQPTISKLLDLITKMERDDILTEILIDRKSIENDAKMFLQRRNMANPVQVEEVTPGPGEPEDTDVITTDDVLTSRRTQYDAFVCYNPAEDGSQDMQFVRELIHKFEAPPYNFKLFVPYRDDLVGVNNHSINAKIISERCRHMIVVVSRNFLRSKACDFQASFAHALSPGARQKRMVPVRLEDVTIPNIMRIMALCDFTKKDLRDWSWVRLAQSIRVPLEKSHFELQTSSLTGSQESAMLPMESLWSRTSPNTPSGTPAPHLVPGSTAFPETGPSSLTDSAIGSGDISAQEEQRLSQPWRGCHTAPLASGLHSSSSSESIHGRAATSVICEKRNSSNPNLSTQSTRGKKRINSVLQPLQKLFRKKKDNPREEDMETGF